MTPARPLLLPDPLPTSATVGSMLLLVTAAALAFRYADPTPLSLACGLALIAAGIAIRLLTNATLRKNEAVCREGPYAVCRHPMSTGTIIAAAGAGVALNHPAAFAPLAVAVAIALHRLRKEEAFLLAKFPAYAQYRAEVPAFPTPGSAWRALSSGRARLRPSLRQCFLNGEVLRLNFYLLLLVAASFYLRVPAGAVAAGAGAAVLLAVLSFRLHPAEAPRQRSDYALPGVVAVVIILLELIG